MIVTVKPSKLRGDINAPTSKSSMQRACAAALLTKGSTIIHNAGKSNDDLAALDVISRLGAKVVDHGDGKITVQSSGVSPVSEEINCGESGLGIRMFTPLAALSSREIIINGKGSLVTRPMHFFDEIFPKLGIAIKSNDGKLPLTIKGPLQPKAIEVDGSLSSQFLTGLLMAFGAAGAKDVSIHVRNLKSKPYIDLTLDVMKTFGVEVENREYGEFYFPPSTGMYKPVEYTVEGDWSGAAFLLVAGAIAGDIVVKGLDINSTQADKAIMQALMSAGAKVAIDENNIQISQADLQGFHFDATDCPDLFPPLVALAAYCKGTTIIEGVSRLAHKESDRGSTLQQEFAKFGVEITITKDKMKINGGTRLTGASTHSHHDHRIAMACAVAALRANGETIIEDAEAINKSYPDFYRHLKSLGASLKEEGEAERKEKLKS
jgi:3-phosphoshikimate 1-carboxyvinyltransferase